MTDGIIAIGNPGSGKSTLLNALAGELLFKSGISFGGGLTYQLDEKSNGNGHFIDTPGLADEELRKKAGEAISKVLKRGGRYRILFFVRERSGRVIVEDIATMKIVLKAAPEIGRYYGIIVNQVPIEIKQGLMKGKNSDTFICRLFYGMDEQARCPFSCIFILEEIEQLRVEKNKVVPLKTLANGDFGRFVYVNVPETKLTQGRAKDLDTNSFDEMMNKVNKLVDALAKSNEAQAQLIQQLLQQQREHNVQLEEERNRNRRERADEIRKMTAQMEELEIRNANNKRDKQNCLEQERQMEVQIEGIKHMQAMESQPPAATGTLLDVLCQGVDAVGAAAAKIVDGVVTKVGDALAIGAAAKVGAYLRGE